MDKKITIITGTVGEDAHSIGSRLLYRVLKDNGFNVVELGGLTPRKSLSTPRRKPRPMRSSRTPSTGWRRSISRISRRTAKKQVSTT
jgi:hypothetical protein